MQKININPKTKKEQKKNNKDIDTIQTLLSQTSRLFTKNKIKT